jgi:hypothetical protein
MPLTAAQLPTLKAHINASADLNVFPNNSDGNTEIQKLLALAATPAFTVWKTMVSIGQVGRAFNGTELAGLTTANLSRLQTIGFYLSGGVNPSLADSRAFFDDVFSGAGGTITRANLLTLWKRLANRAERLYATGTGSDGSPATLVFEGVPTLTEIQAARNLP